MNWVRLAIVAAAVAALVAGVMAVRSHWIGLGDATGSARVQKRWDDQKQVDQAETIRLQQEASTEKLRQLRNAERIAENDALKEKDRARRDRDTAVAVDGMRSTIAALNGRDVSEAGASPAALAAAARAAAARELLGRCTETYRGVAAAADRLRDQVAGLLDYNDTVCHGGAQ